MRVGDHPRTRGEKSRRSVTVLCLPGSPPHTRGKGFRLPYVLSFWRITPAHAGKSDRLRRNQRKEQDHPRTRGEKSATQTSRFRPSGSPPHTRGKVGSYDLCDWQVGITPAHAGKSSKEMRSAVTEKDHPRTRGEKDWKSFDKYSMEGSPPHTRGKAGQSTAALWYRGITPAHAGKSYRRCCPCLLG